MCISTSSAGDSRWEYGPFSYFFQIQGHTVPLLVIFHIRKESHTRRKRWSGIWGIVGSSTHKPKEDHIGRFCSTEPSEKALLKYQSIRSPSLIICMKVCRKRNGTFYRWKWTSSTLFIWETMVCAFFGDISETVRSEPNILQTWSSPRRPLFLHKISFKWTKRF